MADPALLDLPWDLPLESWPNDAIAALPKGISRHLVRFAHLAGHVVAIKETTDAAVRSRDRSRLRRIEYPEATNRPAARAHSPAKRMANGVPGSGRAIA